MAASTAALANKALAHLGVAGRITTLSSDTTPEGKACRQFYTDAVHETLRAHDWRCATKQATLTLVQTFAATTTREWLYQYRLPTDCLKPRRLLWYGVRNPRADQQVPFAIYADTSSTDWSNATAYAVGDYALSGGVWYRCILASTNNTPPNGTYWVAITGGPPAFLHTDQASAILEYTMDLTDPTRFDVDVEAAIAAYLAVLIAPNVTVNGSAVTLQQMAYAKWEHLVANAQARDFMSQQPDQPPMSGYQSARHYRAG